MVFNLNGLLIETTQIQTVSDILKPREDSFNDSESSSDREEEWMDRFVITFIGGRELTFTRWSTERILTIDQLKEIHKQVVDFWNEHKSTIPRITW